MTTALVLHKGAVEVTPDELANVEAPPPSGRWYPVKHSLVLDRVTETLNEAGYHIAHQKLALSKDNHRFFGTLDLTSTLAQGVTLAVGIRNSTDKTFPMGFAAGSRVFVCDNLAFRSELMVRRKHTLNGQMRFGNAIAQAVVGLQQFKELEGQRISLMQATPVTQERAESYILRSYLKGIAPLRYLPKVLSEWNAPIHDHGGATLWSLLQCFTQVMGPLQERNPNEYAIRTMRLQNLLQPA